ncbi:uncharacterized protein H6S33_007899 [Morchella sextelata]|uniref:uncharacterized protein n=1 Tax=Morchella sextelata TaxID=1174677 RepID=UPI001D059EE6|nr:uncharacterized protein H6S33_007899 [Morchella sextelata]KAH0603577.1 hypothetical protein H6S33_007899 [Morchella sextelata]
MSAFYRMCHCSLLEVRPHPVTKLSEWNMHLQVLEQDRLDQLFQSEVHAQAAERADEQSPDERLEEQEAPDLPARRPRSQRNRDAGRVNGRGQLHNIDVANHETSSEADTPNDVPDIMEDSDRSEILPARRPRARRPQANPRRHRSNMANVNNRPNPAGASTQEAASDFDAPETVSSSDPDEPTLPARRPRTHRRLAEPELLPEHHTSSDDPSNPHLPAYYPHRQPAQSRINNPQHPLEIDPEDNNSDSVPIIMGPESDIEMGTASDSEVDPARNSGMNSTSSEASNNFSGGGSIGVGQLSSDIELFGSTNSEDLEGTDEERLGSGMMRRGFVAEPPISNAEAVDSYDDITESSADDSSDDPSSSDSDNMDMDHDHESGHPPPISPL